MKRNTFIKSLLTLILTPKVIGEIKDNPVSFYYDYSSKYKAVDFIAYMDLDAEIKYVTIDLSNPKVEEIITSLVNRR